MSETIKPSIEAVLEYYGADLTQGRVRGAKIKCPFHEDSRPSATYDTEKNSFKCFSCPKQGDSIQLIREEENLGFKDALKFAEEHEWYSGSTVSSTAFQREGQTRPGVLGGKPRVVRSDNKSVRVGVRRRPRI